MQHNFFYKKIGQLSDSALISLQEKLPLHQYIQCIDFPKEVITISLLTEQESTLVQSELSAYFNPSGHLSTNIALMHPMTYMNEHSDHSSKLVSINQPIIKLQIPIITNDKIGMMWRPRGATEPNVVNFKAGGIYIIDNIREHCVVNLSEELRYFITARYRPESLIDKTLLNA